MPEAETARGRVVVGIDGSTASGRALTWGAAAGRLRGAAVRAVHAWQYAPRTVAGWSSGRPPDDLLLDDFDRQRHEAEQRAAGMVADLAEDVDFELVSVEGRPAEVLVGESREADLLVVGSRGHGAVASALLGSVSRACTQHAQCPVVVIRDSRPGEPLGAGWRRDEVIARERPQTAAAWQALTRLGVAPGTALALEFVYESGGMTGDRLLAEFLQSECGYEVKLEPEGVSGQTPAMALNPDVLDEWVGQMVVAGHGHGGCAFDGFTVTLPSSRPSTRNRRP